MRVLSCLALALASFATGLATQPRSTDAKSTLVRTLQKYSHLRTYSATCNWFFAADGNTKGGSRTIQYKAPNLHRIETHDIEGWTMLSISDGLRVSEAVLKRPGPYGWVVTRAPARFGIHKEQLLGSTTFSGYLMYEFFSGKSLAQLVDPKHTKILDGGFADVLGDKCRVVTFTSNLVGKSTVYISAKSLLVRKIVSDFAQVSAMLDKRDRREGRSGKKHHLRMVESYTQIEADEPIADSVFTAP